MTLSRKGQCGGPAIEARVVKLWVCKNN